MPIVAYPLIIHWTHVNKVLFLVAVTFNTLGNGFIFRWLKAIMEWQEWQQTQKWYTVGFCCWMGRGDWYKIRQFVVKRSGADPCNLSVPTYITAPLRTNQKYVYSDLKLHVRKIRSYAKLSDLYTILYQRLTNAVPKGALLPCKRASFTPQKSIFYHAKGHLLPCQSPPVIFNLWIFITTLLMPFSFS